MKNKYIIEINSIIERDSKDSTYKFALLRGIIDIIIEYPQLVITDKENNRLILPFGLLVFSWIFYYYPVFSSPYFIPQKNGENQIRNQLAIRKPFNDFIKLYEHRGGIESFYNDFKRNRIPDDVQKSLKKLVTKIATTIKTMPMKYLGYSYFGSYNQVAWHNNDAKNISPGFSFRGYESTDILGTFNIPLKYFPVFENLGRYILGNSSLLSKWTDFTMNLKTARSQDNKCFYELLLKSPNTERNVRYVKSILKNRIIYCVWSGKKLNDYALDHIIPFSIWPNNFLWNLLPSSKSINLNKSDFIPEKETLLKSKERILYYWDIYSSTNETLFSQEIKYSLAGFSYGADRFFDNCFDRLTERCLYFIKQGCRPWNYTIQNAGG